MLSRNSVKNVKLLAWVDDISSLCRPSAIHWCDGSDEESRELSKKLVESGTFIRLNEKKRPNCFLARSDKSDVARVEDRTFICSVRKDDAGPTNNWVNPKEMKASLSKLFRMSGSSTFPTSPYGNIRDNPIAMPNPRFAASLVALVAAPVVSEPRPKFKTP